MRPYWHARWRLSAAAIDALFVGGALIGWTVARFGPSAVGPALIPALTRDFGRAPLAFALPSWIAAFVALRLYSPQRCQNSLDEGRRLVVAAPAAATLTVFLGFLVKENPARSWLAGALVLGTIAASVGRQTLRAVVTRLRRRGRWMTRTVIVGGAEAKRVVEAVRSDRALGIEPVGACGFELDGLRSWDVGELVDAVRISEAAQVIVVPEGLPRSTLQQAIEIADDLPVSVVVLPGLDYFLLGSLDFVMVGHEPGLVLGAPTLHPFQRKMKRSMDVAIAGVLLLATAPLMALSAVLIRIESRGPVIFRQPREGLGGHVFDVLKFRTMANGAETLTGERESDAVGFAPKVESDPRVTRVGRLLRKMSLDELPQLWNVVRGDMSLVGPRPLSLWEAERVSLRRRMKVRPGLTGLWQVSGRSALSPEERVRLDLVYVQNWSLLLDLSILFRTVPAVIGRRGAF